MKVLFLSYEVAPIYKFGGLGDVAGALPKALAKLGIDVRIGMPKYSGISQVKYLPGSQVPLYFAKSRLFLGEGVKGNQKDTRKVAPAFANFAKSMLEEAKRQKFQPDIIHLNDWHTSLIPFWLTNNPDPFFSKTKFLLTIHNTMHQGIFPIRYLKENAETHEIGRLLQKELKLKVNFLRMGISFVRWVNTVSPNFAKEIKRKKNDFGLGRLLRSRKRHFIGILNGIDKEVWSPLTDKLIKVNFLQKNLTAGKEKNKYYLQKDLKLPIENIPVFGLIARLSYQKGFQILLKTLPELIKLPLQTILLGTGDRKITREIKQFTHNYPQRLAFVNDFAEKTAHQIYAGSDFFLIPSIFEPCGLTQMISMAYGTIPVASAVGGLKDSIVDGKTGLFLSEITSDGLIKAVKQALEIWQDKEKLNKMRLSAMRKDFSWNKSAREYTRLYRRVIGI